MIEDDDAPEGNGHLAERLAQLERAIGEQSARLRAIEQRLGIAPHVSSARPFGQGGTPSSDTEGQTKSAHPPSMHQSAVSSEDVTEVLPSISQTDREEAAQSQTISATDAARAGIYEEDESTVEATPAGKWRVDEFNQDARPTREEEQAANERARAAMSAATEFAKPARAWSDLEAHIGGSWFNWIGIIALALGIGFFLKYAFDNQWIGPTGRVLLGGAAGCAILGLAERLRLRGYRSYAYVLSGGGILILYLSVYAAFAFYHLIGQPLAFVLMAVVTTTAVLLSARYDALPIAILGLIGGFLTPVLLSQNVDNEVGLFSYIALLDAGVLALAYFKSWRSLNHLSFLATWLLFAGWSVRWYEPEKLWTTIFFLTLFFVMFSALALVHNIVKQRMARWLDISLIITNATIYFGTSYALLASHQQLMPGAVSLPGAHALLLSAFYVLLFFTAHGRHRADRLLAFSYIGATVTFFTIAIALQFDEHWVTIGWATEALLLTWIGLRTETSAPRYAALPVFAVAITHWFSVDLLDFAYHTNETFTPLLNRRAVSCAALVAACYGTLWLYRRYGEEVDKDECELLSIVFILAGSVLALVLLTVDLNDYFMQRRALAPHADFTAQSAIENTRQFSLTVLWTLYAALALVIGLTRRLPPLRFGALVLLAVAIFKLLTLDIYYYDASWHLLIFNQTFISFAVVVGVLALVARFYRRAEHVGEKERTTVLHAILAVANLVALIGLSVEAMGYFNRVKALAWALPDGFREAARVENNKQLTLSAIWTLYAANAFYVGIKRLRETVRYAALGLLAVAGAKILLVDATYYNASWHLLILNQTATAFALYILVLAFISRLYALTEEIGTEERARVAPALTIVANLFAIIALSLEATGHFEKLIRAGRPGANELRDVRLAKQLSLSVIWAIYGGALFVVGLVRRSRLLRIMALSLLGLTTAKVFFFDLSSLDKIYRIISFIVLGAILLAVSFLYQQRQQRAAKAEKV